MALHTQPLRDEHKELLPHVDQLLDAADSLQGGTGSIDKVAAAYDFLAHHLLVHAAAEEAALYPVVSRVMGAPEATKTMMRDHAEIRRMTEQLAAYQDVDVLGNLNRDQSNDLRRLLYGLYSMVKLHFAKEEEVYLPLLDQRLTAQEAASLFESLERAAGEARAAQQ